MKFFVPLDEAPLGTHPELIGVLVPFILDYPCYRRLKEGSPEKQALFTYEIIQADEPRKAVSGKT